MVRKKLVKNLLVVRVSWCQLEYIPLREGDLGGRVQETGKLSWCHGIAVSVRIYPPL
jgi:hypothetical protein